MILPFLMLAAVASTQSKQFYLEHKITALKIMDAYLTGCFQVLLNAMMQSGKTGVFMYVAFSMIQMGKVKQVVILCGSNEKDLHDQLKKDRDDYAEAFVGEQGLSFRQGAQLCDILINSVKIIKSSDLESYTISNETLVIWDESHFAQGIHNLPNRMLERSGLKVTGTPSSDELWAAKKCYFMSVSATPFPQFSDIHNTQYANTCLSIQHIPGPRYIGVQQFVDADRIHESFSLKTDSAKFQRLLAEYAGQTKYVLVRSLKNSANIKACCDRVGADYIEYNSTHKDIVNLDALKTAPRNLTVVVLKGMCRMGKVVTKRHIAFAFEDCMTSKSDCVLQSLLGRMCGYEEDYGIHNLPHVYVSPAFMVVKSDTGLSELDRYCGYVKDGTMMPTKAPYLKKSAVVSGKNLLPFPIEFVLRNEDSDDFGEAEQFRSADFVEKARMIADLALPYYTTHPIPDVVQHDEVMRKLMGGGSARDYMSIHNINSETYGPMKTALLKAYATKTRFDDPAFDHHTLKAIYDDSGEDVIVYLVGHTENASPDTVVACKAPIAATTGKEVWNPAHDDTVIEHDPEIVNDVADLDVIQTKPGKHAVWIKKTLLKNPTVKGIVESRIKGKGGKQAPKAWKLPKADYERVLFMVTLTVRTVVTTTTTVSLTAIVA